MNDIEIVHTLIVGVTMSGKTTLARALCRDLLKKGGHVMVFDPMGTKTAGGGWGESDKLRVVHSIDGFLDAVHSDDFQGADVIVDEAHKIFGHQMSENLWMLTEGRHFGLRFTLLTQRPTKLHPDARSNCGRVFMFRLARDDAQAIGNDYGHSDLHKKTLDRGDYLYILSGQASYSTANIFHQLKGST